MLLELFNAYELTMSERASGKVFRRKKSQNKYELYDEVTRTVAATAEKAAAPAQVRREVNSPTTAK